MFGSEDFSDFGNDDGGSSLTEAIIGAISDVGSAALLSSRNPSLGTPYPQPVSSFGYTPQNYGKSSTSSFLLIVIIIIAGAFAFTHIKK